MARPLSLGLSVSVAALAVDQLVKWWIIAQVLRVGEIIPVLPFFNLVLVSNQGISFGFFNFSGAANAWILSAIALAIIIFLIAWLRKAEAAWTAAAIGLIIGGALGNVADRVTRGAVVDFLDFHWAGFHWPAFNAADSFIAIGAVYLVAESLFSKGRAPDRMTKR